MNKNSKYKNRRPYFFSNLPLFKYLVPLERPSRSAKSPKIVNPTKLLIDQNYFYLHL